MIEPLKSFFDEEVEWIEDEGMTGGFRLSEADGMRIEK